MSRQVYKDTVLRIWLSNNISLGGALYCKFVAIFEEILILISFKIICATCVLFVFNSLFGPFSLTIVLLASELQSHRVTE